LKVQLRRQHKESLWAEGQPSGALIVLVPFELFFATGAHYRLFAEFKINA
jgi:hypothetical protein